MTSFWKSTNALTREALRSVGRSRLLTPVSASSPSTLYDAALAVKPASDAAAAPAAAPSSSAALSPKRPLQAPAERHSSVGLPGRNIWRSSSQSSLPLVCENRCTLGVQPPDIRSASQAMVCAGPTTPLAETGLTLTEATRSRPPVSVTVWPTSVLMPDAAARAARASGTLLRISTIAAT